MIGKYTLNKGMRLHIGVSSVGLPKGIPVEVSKIDDTFGKILVRSDDRCVDWFDSSFIKNLEPIDSE